MRRLQILILLLLSLVANGNTYYVAPDGDNGNAGTIASPWATFQYAITSSIAGDTVYIRGGTYNMTNSNGDRINTKLGTISDPICYFNYPGEFPVFDCSGYPTDQTYMWGMQIINSSNIKIRGIKIRDIAQRNPNGIVYAVYMENSTNIIIENCVVSNIGGVGYGTAGSNNILYLNCDAEFCADPYTTTSSGPYGAGDGWQTSSNGSQNSYVLFKGCRALFCSDDGFDSYWNDGTVVYDSCWALSNYKEGGDGNGWKLGANFTQGSDSIQRSVTNCISVNHSVSGYNTNHVWAHSVIYNNVSYNDSIGYYHLSSGDYTRYVTFRNNIAHDFWEAATFNFDDQPNVIDDYNTWNGGVTLSDLDFISLDTTALYAERQSDGSLPLTNFMKLAPTSDLIDAGVSVGLDYYGSAPDLGWAEYTPGPQIIADHSIVADYDKIPQYYIDSVKKMWLSYPGESHSLAIPAGLLTLEGDEAAYAVNVTTSGTPETYTDDYLRVARAMWGNVVDADSWYYSYGEEDWWANSTAVTRTKAGLTYANAIGNPISAVGFGWCWDEISRGNNISTIDPVYGAYWGGFYYNSSNAAVDVPWGLDDADNALTGNTINMDDYLTATQSYIDYCADSIPTQVFFTTPPTNGGWMNGSDYQATLKAQHIRDYVLEDSTRILFDYADILAYDDNGDSTLNTWGSYTYPHITPTNEGDESVGHISEIGSVRLAKAMWWMLARMAGWDGNVTVYSEPEVDATLTDILTFTLPTQTGAATINTTAHTVAIEVNYLATITNLTPYIAVSYGATISPESMTSRDFTTPQTYTVTALDGTTTQSWTVTVTQEEEPTPSSSNPLVHNGRWIVHEGVWVKI